MDLLVDALVKVLAANNRRIELEWQKAFRDAQMGNLIASAGLSRNSGGGTRATFGL
jgi:hypothetical protein